MSQIVFEIPRLIPFRKSRRVTTVEVASEPFRLFFPLAFVAGILGVAMWPLFFGGVLTIWPGVGHARIMAHGFFGGFIIGFLGTAGPRLMDLRPLRIGEVVTLAVLHAAMVGAHLVGANTAGDIAFLGMLLAFGSAFGIRIRKGASLPPPGFVLVGLAWLCAAAGPVIALTGRFVPLTGEWVLAERLLTYQGFVLFPVLGVAGFLLPKFLGVASQCRCGDAGSRAWRRQALKASVVGAIILGTFALEANGWYRTAYASRFLVATLYLLCTTQIHRLGFKGPHVAMLLKSAVAMILLGLLLVAMFPVFRTALLHVTLVGGFALLTFAVATRVVFGHSGNRVLIAGKARWLLVAAAFMLVGMATRISADYFPKVLISHYNYGALFWAVGAGVWAWKVLPKVLQADPED